jgi:hypothetical protein
VLRDHIRGLASPERFGASARIGAGRNGRDMEKRKFAIGQCVTVVPSRTNRSPTDNFDIVRFLPIESGGPQYRIKSRRDGHERVMMESELQ